MDGAAEAKTHGGLLLTRGHPGAVAAIAHAVRGECPPHALLVVGPRGVGKTTLALDLAAGLLCGADDPAARPCRACPACRKVAAGNHPDLHLVEPEGAGEQIRIAQVQQLISELALTAMEGRFRVAVVTAAHRLNLDAQNALLKTLEARPRAGGWTIWLTSLSWHSVHSSRNADSPPVTVEVWTSWQPVQPLPVFAASPSLMKWLP